MNNLIISAATILLLITTGCGPSAQKIKKNTAEANPVIKAKTSIYPHWVENPALKGYLSVVGSARVQKSGNPAAQHRVAMLTARAELSRVYNSHVENTSDSSTTTSSSGTYQHTDSSSSRVRSSSALQLSDAVVLEQWTHPDTKELFIWLALPLK